MQRLSGLSRRYLQERRGRALLVGTGIALGVTVLFSSLVTITSFNRGLRQMRFNSPGMDLVAFPSAGGNRPTVDNAVIDELAATDGVDGVVRFLHWPVSIAAGRTPDVTYTSGNQRLFGVDRDELARFVEVDPLYDLEPTVGRWFAEDADEVMLSESHAAYVGVTAGDHIALTNLPDGERRMLVVGLLSDTSLARRNSGELIFTSLSAARRVAEKPGGVSWAGIYLEDGTTPTAWLAAHDDARLDFETAESSVADLRATIGELGSILRLLASFILFVAGFLIFLTLSMAVAERQATLGILRALGASRAHLFRLIVVEAAAIGVVATAVGTAAGYGIAYLNLTHHPWGRLPYPTGGVPVTLGTVAATAGLGVGATVVAAIVPAWRAARMAPLDAIREPVGLGRGSRRQCLVGVLLFPAGLALTSAYPSDELRVGVGLFVAMAGAILVVPAVLPWVCRRLLVLAAARPIRLVYVVIPHLSRERTRSAYTLGLAMAVMAMATGVGATISSADHTGDMQFDAQATDVVNVHSGLLDRDLLRRIEDTPGVGAATASWWGSTQVPNAEHPETLVAAIDPATYFDVAGFAWAAGSDADIERRLSGAGHVVLPEHLARELDLAIGDTVNLVTNDGPKPFAVAGIYVSIASSRSANESSAVVVGRNDGRAQFGFDWPASGITARVEPAADVEAVVEAVKDLQTDTSFVVVGEQEIRAGFDNMVAVSRSMILSVLVPAALVSALGLANTLAVAVLERRRELGVLRAIGLRRSQARSLALLEAGVLVAVAAVLSIPLGFAVSQPLVAAGAAAFGTVFHYAFPWSWLVVTAVTALGLAMVAAIAPARRAARLDVSAALRFE